MTSKIACATMYFSYVSSGMLLNVGVVVFDDPVPDPDADCAMVKAGFVGSFELVLSVWVRSRAVGPELRCWRSVASTAVSPGFWFEKAQMMLSLALLVSTGMVNTSLGLVPVSVLSDASAVAMRGGLESTVGMTSDGAFRCESVTDPSEFGHIMTIGVFAICAPKPLHVM